MAMASLLSARPVLLELPCTFTTTEEMANSFY